MPPRTTRKRPSVGRPVLALPVVSTSEVESALDMLDRPETPAVEEWEAARVGLRKRRHNHTERRRIEGLNVLFEELRKEADLPPETTKKATLHAVLQMLREARATEIEQWMDL